ncbi:MAG TPA: PilW family protein [Gallionellaceae bacterium]|nr:PilW family protein [Gallionellaceae bacterium]
MLFADCISTRQPIAPPPFALGRFQPVRKHAAGFSLVEIMVGMVIGLLAMIVMMQMLALFEGQKRSSTGGGDAQNSGAIALHGIQRDLKQSGYGINQLSMLGCSVTLRPGVTLNSLAPVTINSTQITGQDSNTDTLLVVYSQSNSPTEGNGINAQPTAINKYQVRTPSAFQVGDIVISVPKTRLSPCTLSMETVTSIDATNSLVQVPNGVAGMVGGLLFNLGPSVKVLAYAVRGGKLTVCDYMANDCSSNSAAFWPAIASDIVSMKAEYGRDTSAVPMTGIASTFDRTTPASTSATLSCDWLRILSVSLALVARSSQYNKEVVTNTAVNSAAAPNPPVNAPTWSGNSRNAIVASTSVLGPDTSVDEPWKHYRYKVFQTTVPLRNNDWMVAVGAQRGC